MLLRLFQTQVLISAVSLLIVLQPDSAQSGTTDFDTCVYSLFNMGGLSKAKARKVCLKGLTKEALHCQNKRFFGGENPEVALTNSSKSQSARDLGNYTLKRGIYQPEPVDPVRKNVCSITVNSSDEREAFRKNLDPAKYSWVELLPSPILQDDFIARDDFWLKRACAEKIRCDILVVSGHFASTYLGTSGFEIQIEDLTKASCDSGCKEFFGSIEQVYLFGCNTLAGRDRDKRTPWQYSDLLTHYDVSPHQSQRIAARRYTPYNQTIREEVRKIFFNAKQIAGYPALGPTGPNIKDKLTSYLRTGSFSETLGRTGMVRTTGQARDSMSCESTQAIIRDPELQNFQGLKKYIEMNGQALPLPAADLIVEAHAKQMITEGEAQELFRFLIRQSPTDRTQRRNRLCPLVLTEFKNLVPTDLACVENDSWLYTPKKSF